jgi:hypothetical protein
MRLPSRILAAFAAVCFTTVAAFAADVSPSGTWKYTQPGRGGNAGVERTLILEAKDGTLTGTLKGVLFRAWSNWRTRVSAPVLDKAISERRIGRHHTKPWDGGHAADSLEQVQSADHRLVPGPYPWH